MAEMYSDFCGIESAQIEVAEFRAPCTPTEVYGKETLKQLECTYCSGCILVQLGVKGPWDNRVELPASCPSSLPDASDTLFTDIRKAA